MNNPIQHTQFTRIPVLLTFQPLIMSLWTSPPTPVSKLARYRTLSPLAGVRVSPIQLGAMSIGDKWCDIGFGPMNKESSFKLLDAYFDLGVCPSCIPWWCLLQLIPRLKGKLHRHCKLLVRLEY